jgi:hypothetical protein
MSAAAPRILGLPGAILRLPGAIFSLAATLSGQEGPQPAVAAAPPPVATGWIEPVLPDAWQDPDEPHEPPEDWRWDADGLLSLQYTDWGGRNASENGLDTQTATIIVTGRYGDDFRLWIEPDFDGENTRHNLSELWGEWTLAPDQWLRVGQMRVALGTEFETRHEDLLFVGYAYPTWLYGRYDTGARYDAYATDNLWWALAGTVGEGFDLEGGQRENPLFMIRGALTPEQRLQDGRREFEGLFGGAAFAYSPDGDDHIIQDTPLEQTTFTTPDLDGEAEQFVHWEGGLRTGPFRAGLENIVGDITEVPSGAPGDTNDMEELTSWAGYVAFNFTGDAPRWERGGWAPYTQADHDAGKALPVELGFRYSNSDIDRDLFDLGVISFDTSSQETRTLSTVLSAYLNPDTRLALQWLFVIVDDNGLPPFDGEDRTSNLVLRWDQWFGR